MPGFRNNLKAYAIALGIVIVLVLAAWVAASRKDVPSGSRDDAYAAQVSLQGVKVLGAESLIGGSVVYYRGTIRNRGDRALTGYIVDLTFHDLYGKPIKTERRALLANNVPPIPPHSTRNFEIGFDQFPAGWNQAPPTPSAVAVYIK